MLINPNVLFILTQTVILKSKIKDVEELNLVTKERVDVRLLYQDVITDILIWTMATGEKIIVHMVHIIYL